MYLSMKQFTSQNTITIQRQTYTNGVSAFSTVGTANAYLRSLSMQVAAQNGFQYGFAFSLICEVNVNLKVGDKVIISGTTYTVKGVATKGGDGLPTNYVEALVTLPEA